MKNNTEYADRFVSPFSKASGEKIDAEFPVNRYFYKFIEPKKSKIY